MHIDAKHHVLTSDVNCTINTQFYLFKPVMAQIKNILLCNEKGNSNFNFIILFSYHGLS